MQYTKITDTDPNNTGRNLTEINDVPKILIQKCISRKKSGGLFSSLNNPKSSFNPA
jgi:hypothetical protein